MMNLDAMDAMLKEFWELKVMKIIFRRRQELHDLITGGGGGGGGASGNDGDGSTTSVDDHDAMADGDGDDLLNNDVA